MSKTEKELYDILIEFAKKHNLHAEDVVVTVDTSAETLIIQELLPDGYDGLYTETLYESKSFKVK